MNAPLRGSGNISQRMGAEADKELGLGMPPDECQRSCGIDPDVVIAMKCDPRGLQTTVESVDWSIIGPVSDANIQGTYGQRINIWGTTDGQPPAGVADATNSLNTPGIFSDHTVMTSMRFRFEVENFGLTVEGGFLPQGINAATMPGVPDAWSKNDETNALGLAQGQVMIPGKFMVNLPAWWAFEAFIKGYNVLVKINEENLIMNRRLSSVKAVVRPFGEAEGMGVAFTPIQALIAEGNQQLKDLAQTGQFVKRTHERLGTLANNGTPIGDFTVSQESDTASTVFGGSGGEGNDDMRACQRWHVFAKPMFWPAGRPLGIEYQSRSDLWRRIFHRWFSVTGGVDGAAGNDLNLGQSPNAALTGYAPTNTGANVMVEQTLDVATTFISQQQQTNEALVKLFHARMAVDIGGFRVREPWFPYVLKRVQNGAIYAPFGAHELGG